MRDEEGVKDTNAMAGWMMVPQLGTWKAEWALGKILHSALDLWNLKTPRNGALDQGAECGSFSKEGRILSYFLGKMKGWGGGIKGGEEWGERSVQSPGQAV